MINMWPFKKETEEEAEKRRLRSDILLGFMQALNRSFDRLYDESKDKPEKAVYFKSAYRVLNGRLEPYVYVAGDTVGEKSAIQAHIDEVNSLK